MTRTLIRNERGNAAMEFALVAPTFLMFIFLLLDCGRMLFAKQSLNEVATATARCFAIKATGCTTAADAQSWSINRALTRDNLALVGNTVIVSTTTCNGVANMARASVTTIFKKGAMTFLPQSVAPSTLTSVACFPIAT